MILWKRSIVKRCVTAEVRSGEPPTLASEPGILPGGLGRGRPRGAILPR